MKPNNNGGRRHGKGSRNAKSKRRATTKAQCDMQQERRNSTLESEPANDISWYAKYPDLLQAAGNIPFPYRPGMQIPLSIVQNTGSVNKMQIPGICTINWAPFVGVGGEPTDPINTTAREIFSKVRAAFSGSIDADGPDFIMYFLALDSIFSYIASLKRIFRLVSAYTANNYLYPKALLNMLGVGPSGAEILAATKMTLFGYINELIYAVRKFVCPAFFPVFDRHYWLNDNLFADADSLDAQVYACLQSKFLKFEVTGTPAVGQLTYTDAPWKFDGTSVSSSELYVYGINLINALSAWDDAFIISGYLQRAFGNERLFEIALLDYGERPIPVYNPEVLMQIENAFCPWDNDDVITLNAITQDPTSNTVSTNITYSVQLTQPKILPHLNIHSPNPGLADVIEASRLMTYYDFNDSQKLVAGTEIVLGMNVYLNNAVTSFSNQATLGSGTTVENVLYLVNVTAELSAHDWHPFVYITYEDTGYSTVYGDIHNLTTLSYEQLKQINRVCLFSEFNTFTIQ